MTATLVLLLAASVSPAAQQPVPPGPQPRPQLASASVAEEIARLQANRPGTEHRWLDPLVGSWSVELRWQNAAGSEVRLSGTAENRWILDGRFLLCEVTAGEGASRLEGTSIYGFDARQKRHFALNLHSLASYPTQLSGTYDPVTRSFLLSARERDDATGAVFVDREVLKIDGPDRHLLELYVDLPGRTPTKVVEAVFTRRSEAARGN